MLETNADFFIAILRFVRYTAFMDYILKDKLLFFVTF